MDGRGEQDAKRTQNNRLVKRRHVLVVLRRGNRGGPKVGTALRAVRSRLRTCVEDVERSWAASIYLPVVFQRYEERVEDTALPGARASALAHVLLSALVPFPVVARCAANDTAKFLREMTLVREPKLTGDLGERFLRKHERTTTHPNP